MPAGTLKMSTSSGSTGFEEGSPVPGPSSPGAGTGAGAAALSAGAAAVGPRASLGEEDSIEGTWEGGVVAAADGSFLPGIPGFQERSRKPSTDPANS